MGFCDGDSGICRDCVLIAEEEELLLLPAPDRDDTVPGSTAESFNDGDGCFFDDSCADDKTVTFDISAAVDAADNDDACSE